MNRLKLPALLGSLTILAFSGVGHTNQHVTGPVLSVHYEDATDIIVGYPENSNAWGLFKRTDKTIHVPAIIVNPGKGPQLPPNPCTGLSRAWNAQLAKGGTQTEQRKSLTKIIGNMAKHQCTFIVGRDESSAPAEIETLQPTGQ